MSGAPDKTEMLYGADVTHSGTQTLTTAVEAAVLWDTNTRDALGFHSTGSNTDRFTCPAGAGGTYLVEFYLNYAGNATGRRATTAYLNGSTAKAADVRASVVANTISVTLTLIIRLVATDYVNVKAFQDSGGNLTLTPVAAVIRRIGP
jgi:hypothetical protein